MLKPWSITTTVRNPERLRDFLTALQPLVGKQWNKENQEKYQKILIQKRLYGYGSPQFYSGLPRNIVDLINNIDEVIDDLIVDRIVEIKNYVDFDMRGRQSINPLTKFGFAFVDNGILKITDLGYKLIASQKDFGEVFLKSFIKWQIPNPANDDYVKDSKYDVVPFVATLKLIDTVNKLESDRGNKPKGISKREFSLFTPTLLGYKDIDNYAKNIIDFRDIQKNKTKNERKEIRDKYRLKFAEKFLDTREIAKVNKLLTNLKDYGDNTIRYFRLTKFIRIRGGGFYIDLEPNRHVEIDSLFEKEFFIPKKFGDRNDYLNYMSNDGLPVLPWQTKKKLLEITSNIRKEIIDLQSETGIYKEIDKDTSTMSESELNEYISKLRDVRTQLQEKNNHIKSQPVESIDKYIEQLGIIYELENRALMLEYLSTMGLHALNDAKEIRPNYPVGDDNEPTSTAPGGMSDIECYYDSFNMICEVTMLNGRDQWFNEGQPVMRHLRDFENMHDDSYCIFIAPTIHTDSAETFYIANTVGYKGIKQRIAPITIKQFVHLLKTLKQVRESGKQFKHEYMKNLISEIVESAKNSPNSDLWVESVNTLIDSWSSNLVN